MKDTGKILTLLFFGVFLGALDISIAGPALAAIAEDIRVPQQQLSLIFTLYILSNLSGLPFLSRLSDLAGRRLVFRLGLWIFLAGSLITAMAESAVILFVGRALQGLGAAGIFPVATAVIGDVFPPEKRGRALGTIGAVFGIAFMLGPPMAALILKYLSWHYLFLFNIPVALIILAFSGRLPGKTMNHQISFNLPGIVLMAVFLVFFTLTFTYSKITWPLHFLEKIRLEDWYPVFMVLFLVLLLAHEKNAENPVLNIHFLRIRQVLLAGLLALGLGVSQSVFVFIPRITMEVFAVPVWKAGLMIMPAILGSAVASPLAGRMIDKLGSKIVISAGLTLAALGFILYSRMGDKLYWFYFSGILTGIGLAIRPGLNYIILNEAGALYRATAQGVLTVYVSMGQIAGTAFTGNMLSAGKNWKTAFLWIGIFIALLAIASAGLKPRASETREMVFETSSERPG
ncbi:MAG: MFS transporter [Bacteroidales bacterium]